MYEELKCWAPRKQIYRDTIKISQRKYASIVHETVKYMHCNQRIAKYATIMSKKLFVI